MIDIKEIRDNPARIKESITKRGIKLDIDEFLDIDSQWRAKLSELEELKSSSKIDGKPTDEQLEQLKSSKKEIKELEEAVDKLSEKRMDLYLLFPNYISDTVPEGDEENNLEVERIGDCTVNNKAITHDKLMEKLDLSNFEKGAEVSGSKFFYLHNDLTMLWRAIVNYTIDKISSDFDMLTVPHMVNEKTAAGTGYLPKSESEQNYRDKGQGLVLIATSEIPITAFHQNEVLDLSNGPKYYSAISPCYRLEAGAYGKYSKGLYRVHQFEKLEMYAFSSSEDSKQAHDFIVSKEVEIYKELGLPFRKVKNAVKDLAASAYDKYDLEYYSPIEDEFLEITSCSNCTDYQSRRLNIKYIDKDGKKQFAHTVNGTAITYRTMIAIMENYQNEDATNVTIPEVLIPYYGSSTLIKA